MTTVVPLAPPTASLPRLLPPGNAPLNLAAHLQRFGYLPSLATDFSARLAASGLRGRGGAAFPTARKLGAVAARGSRSVVVANGAESEPASGKDRTLLTLAPHLVLDGVAVAARAVGASEAIVCVDQAAVSVQRALASALGERAGGGHAAHDPVPVRVALVPSRYVAGEETALVNRLNGGDAKPTFVPPRPFERGVSGRPTLVDNVETLAHLALVARYGPEWFRQVGTPDAPGSMLVTLSGAVARPGVLEAACGTPLHELLAAVGGAATPLSAFVLGGYFGTWSPAGTAMGRPVDLTVGAGVIYAFPASSCGLIELARLARWMAGQSARQCGPCTFGLPAIADGVAALAQGAATATVVADLRRHLGLVIGRGACHLPDGASRMIASGLDTFNAEIAHHQAGRCTAINTAPILPLPSR